MKYVVEIQKPGIAGFNRRNEPEAFPLEVIEFDAASHTEALNIGTAIYAKTGLGGHGHFNVGRPNVE